MTSTSGRASTAHLASVVYAKTIGELTNGLVFEEQGSLGVPAHNLHRRRVIWVVCVAVPSIEPKPISSWLGRGPVVVTASTSIFPCLGLLQAVHMDRKRTVHQLDTPYSAVEW